jgi:hypothetical protein
LRWRKREIDERVYRLYGRYGLTADEIKLVDEATTNQGQSDSMKTTSHSPQHRGG